MIGIYKITNTVNGKVYIGLSKDIERRWNEHLTELSSNRHSNVFLQRDYNSLEDKDNFIFEVIEECSQEDLSEREIYWIDFYQSYKNPSKGYNLSPGGEFFNTYGERHWKAKFTEEFVIKCRKLASEGATITSLAKRFDVNRNSLNDAVCGARWKHLNEKHPPVRRNKRLTKEVVIQARLRASEGEKQRSLAEEFNVGFNCLNDAITGRTWKHLNDIQKPYKKKKQRSE